MVTEMDGGDGDGGVLSGHEARRQALGQPIQPPRSIDRSTPTNPLNPPHRSPLPFQALAGKVPTVPVEMDDSAWPIVHGNVQVRPSVRAPFEYVYAQRGSIDRPCLSVRLYVSICVCMRAHSAIDRSIDRIDHPSICLDKCMRSQSTQPPRSLSSPGSD